MASSELREKIETIVHGYGQWYAEEPGHSDFTGSEDATDRILAAVREALLSDEALDAITQNSKDRMPLMIPADMTIGPRMMNRARMEAALAAIGIGEVE